MEFIRLAVLLLAVTLSTGCVRLALRFSSSLIPNFAEAFFEECDPDLAEHSLPAELKLLEGLLKNDPTNRQLLTALCMGFTGYALLFVEDDDPERASQLYLRAANYGVQALGTEGLDMAEKVIPYKLTTFGERELESLFWTSMSWNGWINLNLDRPAALAQLSIAQACLERVLEIRPEYFFGAPYILMGSIFAARPGIFGGDEVVSKECFEKAMLVSQGKFLLAHYYFARYYAVRVQNMKLFLELVKEIEDVPANELKEVCLVNAVIKRKTRRLKETSEELFF
ncbi:MAG: TRAP transporter TatT component family protein [Thermodesulfobacteriota bacterium]|nr:TRAP transporter TatT component family protein [Thermodesulfobacteriota bacterium]